MKILCRLLPFVILGILLTGCRQPQLGLETTPTLPGDRVTATTTSMPSVSDAEPTETVTPDASATSTLWLTDTPEATLTPTITPTIDPTTIPAALSVEAMDSFNGHTRQRITGWKNGFDDFKWVDINHLLLYPITGCYSRFGIDPALKDLDCWKATGIEGAIMNNHSAVTNLASGKTWIPSNPPYLLPNIGILVPERSLNPFKPATDNQEDAAVIYSPDGDFIKKYLGKLLSVSPSGTKILIDGGTWIDLVSEKIVSFSWYQNYETFGEFAYWSPDETRVYACCYLYGDVNTGESFAMPNNKITIDGTDAGSENPLINSYGIWVLNGTYFLSQWGIVDKAPNFALLFDPAAKTYRNLEKLAGIPTDPDPSSSNNCHTDAIPGGRYIWANCDNANASYLIDLTTFASTAYPGNYYPPFNWSKDGAFASIKLASSDDFMTHILSTATKELTTLPIKKQYPSPVWWHPTDDILAYLSEDQLTLLLLDAPTMTIQKNYALPTKFRDVAWRGDGKSIALVGEDGNIWQIDYPEMAQLEQLTPAAASVKDITWSPDGAQIAFMDGADIYIVATNRKP